MVAVTDQEVDSMLRFSGDVITNSLPRYLDDQSYWGFDRAVYIHDWKRLLSVYSILDRPDWYNAIYHRKVGTLTQFFEDMHAESAKKYAGIDAWAAAYNEDRVSESKYVTRESPKNLNLHRPVHKPKQEYFYFRDLRDIFVYMDAEAKDALNQGLLTVFELPPVKRYRVQTDCDLPWVVSSINAAIDTYNANSSVAFVEDDSEQDRAGRYGNIVIGGPRHETYPIW